MLTVLIADDEAAARDDMIACIDWERHGIRVVGTAQDGGTALGAIRRKRPDVVLMDIQMPGMNGLEVIEAVRREQPDAAPAFIIVSGYDEFRYAQAAVHLSVEEYLLKPVSPRDIIAAIQAAAQRTGAIRSAAPAGGQPATRAPAGGAVYPIVWERRLLEAIQAGQMEEIRPTLDRFIREAAQANGQEEDGVFLCCQVLCIEICRLPLERGAGRLEVDLPDKAGNRTVEALRDWMLAEACRLCEALRSTSGSARVVGLAAEYIQQHYAESLSLRAVAEEIHVTPTYLSGQFSRHMGVNFVDYIHRIRIARAKELLSQSGAMIQEVAFRVGYNDTKYFSSVFKKVTGVPPSEFRVSPGVEG